ncbi:MAG: SPOR domain-containing protein [Gemmatimonadota bacterium]|nr:SPOR domain-containing protein [Gemmatimonadota bacterium]
MTTWTGFRSPEAASEDLGVPLLGVLASPEAQGTHHPVRPPATDDIPAFRQVARAVAALLHARPGPVCLVGDMPPAARSAVSSGIAWALAESAPVVLVDADIRSACLAFDDQGRAQEGLVDVLRYGVRSPRVVAPTEVPGVHLLPAGSGTVDVEGTYRSESVASLFEDLGSGGDLVLVHGPDAADMISAKRFFSSIPTVLLLHEFGYSEAERTRSVATTVGAERCAGLITIGESGADEEVHATDPADEPIVEQGPTAYPGADSGRVADLVDEFASGQTDGTPSTDARSHARTFLWLAGAALAATLLILLPKWSGRFAGTPPAEAPPVAGTPPAEPPVVGPRFGVHVTSFRSPELAAHEVSLLVGAGVPAVHRRVDVPGQGSWFRVFAGPCDTREEANRLLAHIREQDIRGFAQVRILPPGESADGSGGGWENR